jgi:hypothetical protein
MVVNMDNGIINATNQPILNPLTASWLGRADAPIINSQVGNFNKAQTQIIFAQLAYTASQWNPKLFTNQLAGKYQVNSTVLTNYGYLNTQFVALHGTNSLSYSTAWTGQNNITDLLQFLSNPVLQDQLALTYMTDNYNELVSLGAITDSDSNDVQAGMLFVAHLLGPMAAQTWRTMGNASSTVGGYYNAGRYAITVLA